VMMTDDVISDDTDDEHDRLGRDNRRCASNNWPLRHITQERVFLRVIFIGWDERINFLTDSTMYFMLRLTLRKVSG
jgi:hypothetical protein